MKLNPRFLESTFLDPDLNGSFLSESIDTLKRNDQVTGITVSPFWVKKAVRDLGESDCMVSTVVGYPYGFQQSLVKLTEAKEAIAQGALGIHMVWSQTAYRSGMTWPKIEIAQLAKVCHESGCLLSVIVDERWIKSLEELVEIARAIQDGGADYIILGVNESSKPDLDWIKALRANLSSQVGIMTFWDGKNEQLAVDLMQAGTDRLLCPFTDQKLFTEVNQDKRNNKEGE